MNVDFHDFFKLGIASVLLAAAVIDGIIALILYIKAKNKYDKYLNAEGTVSGFIKENCGESGNILYPMIKFKVSEHEYEFKNKYGKSSWKMKEGDAVQVIYHMNNPLEAEIKNKLIQYAFPLFFFAGCIISLISVPLIIIFQKLR